MKSYLDCWIPAFIAFPTILFARRSRVEIIAFTHPWCQCGQRRPCLPWKTKAWRANEWKGPAGHFSWVGHYQQALLSYAVKSFALGQSLCSPGFYAGLPSSLKVFGLWNSTTTRNKEKLWKFICEDKENAHMLPTYIPPNFRWNWLLRSRNLEIIHSLNFSSSKANMVSSLQNH